MSLDVSLYGPEYEVECVCDCCDNKHTRTTRDEYYSRNITHNLGTMADKAGIYLHLWRPEELGIEKASELIEPIREGLRKLKADPSYFKQFNASNGWGLYQHFVPFVEDYLRACEEYPDAFVSASR